MRHKIKRKLGFSELIKSHIPELIGLCFLKLLIHPFWIAYSDIMGGGGGEGGWGITTTLQFLHLALLAPLEALTAYKSL